MAHNNINPSEISDILLGQLRGIDTSLQWEEVGTVLQVSDGVVRIHGLASCEAGELLEFENGEMAVAMNLEEDNVGAILLGSSEDISEGMKVSRTKRIASIRVSEQMLGRVVDPLGNPLDGLGEIGGELAEMPLERKAPGETSGGLFFGYAAFFAAADSSFCSFSDHGLPLSSALLLPIPRTINMNIRG